MMKSLFLFGVSLSLLLDGCHFLIDFFLGEAHSLSDLLSSLASTCGEGFHLLHEGGEVLFSPALSKLVGSLLGGSLGFSFLNLLNNLLFTLNDGSLAAFSVVLLGGLELGRVGLSGSDVFDNGSEEGFEI